MNSQLPIGMSAILLALPLAALPLLAPTLQAQSKKFPGEIKTASMRNRENPPPVAPQSKNATLSDVLPKGYSAPDGVTGSLFGNFDIGKTKIAVLVTRSSADVALPDALYIDHNGDHKFEASEKFSLRSNARDMRGRNLLRGQKNGLEINLGVIKVPVNFSFSKYGDQGARASLQFPNYLHATAKIGDENYVVAVVDGNFNGKFGDADDLWAMAKPGGRPASAYALHGMNEGHFVNGTLTRIHVEGTEIQIDTKAAKGPVHAEMIAHRKRVEHIWSDRFDKEREGFIKQRKLDTSRPLAETPIKWREMTFEEGLKISKQTGKPLFVDVLAFWCVWCYRLDYYTYPDKAVAAALNNDFIPMKIIQEQDQGADYKKVRDLIGSRGIPAMGIFDGDGKLLHKIGGWKKPEDFLAELAKVNAGKSKSGEKSGEKSGGKSGGQFGGKSGGKSGGNDK